VRIAALLLALSAAAAWGIGGILIKKGTDVVTPATILILQYALGRVLVGGGVHARAELGGPLDAIGRRWPLLLALASLQIAGYVVFIVAVKYAGDGSLSTATVVAIAAAYPALVAVLSAPLLGEHLHWNHGLAVALIVGGVVVAQL
jgi:drug/metabolite transporter (DMT)-like permease